MYLCWFSCVLAVVIGETLSLPLQLCREAYWGGEGVEAEWVMGQKKKMQFY